jgi:hypothetical protein
MRIMLVLAGAAVLISVAAIAEKPESAKKDDSQKIICKTEEYVGSLIPKRVCMTRADWEKQRQMEKDAIQGSDLYRQRAFSPPPPPGG